MSLHCGRQALTTARFWKPIDTDHSGLIGSDEPVVGQYSHLDSRQAENPLVSTIAYPFD